MFARLIDFLLCRFASFITGVRPPSAIAEQSSEGHRVYFANHNSHGDFILLWISLPYEENKLALLQDKIIGRKAQFVAF